MNNDKVSKYSEAYLLGGEYMDYSPQAIEICEDFWGNEPLFYKHKCGEFKKYCVEAIFSFNTIAGCMLRLLYPFNESDFDYNSESCPKFFNEIAKGTDTMPEDAFCKLMVIRAAKNVPCDVKEKFSEYYKYCSKLAISMPLPLKLNSKKGNPNGYYHEFPDLFFLRLREHYNDKLDIGCCSEYLYKISKGSKTKWENFVENNYLQDFFDENDKRYEEKPIQLAPASEDEEIMLYKNSDLLRYEKQSSEEKNLIKERFEEYFCKVFYENAVKIIEARAKRLAEAAVDRNIKLI